MLYNFRLLTAALSLECYVVRAAVLPASAEPRVLANSDGITVFEDAIERADGGTCALVVARLAFNAIGRCCFPT